MEDEKIIELFFARSELAIKELDGKYGKVCYSISYNILNNNLDAEECVNDAYSTDPEGFYLLADAAECEHHTVTVNGMSGDLYITPDEATANMLVWTDSAKGLFFSVSAPISGGDLLKLAEGVRVSD